ncbi:MAG: 3-phosphoshikimate 1-carboxyvinyltransferase [Candidatus Omnitrophica bacterium]|nr:3-phosphoshikimate 1-carboxyvinyltransferase [Candidatus Omnitrophota bacterium]
MKPITIKPSGKLTGRMVLPGDKSISHRAIMIGAVAEGKTVVRDILDCDDCNYTIGAFRSMGIAITKTGEYTAIEGKGLRGLKVPSEHLNAGNSGTTIRLLSGILAGQMFDTTLEADSSLSARPMERITEPLSLMGADIKSSGGFPPLVIKGGRLNPIRYSLPVSSAQVKSAVLFAALYADGTTVIDEPFKSRDHTERMLKYFGAGITVDGLKVSLEGGKKLKAKTLDVPGDISSASFFMAAAILLGGSKIRIENVGINPTRAGMLDVLEKMGSRINVTNKKNVFEPIGDIEVESSPIHGISIGERDIPGIIDELPIIFVLASLAKGRTVIKGAEELRVKETDRINSMSANLRAMGARINVGSGEIVIDGVDSLNGASFKSYGDHRTCMAMTVAALAAKGSSAIDDTECVNKSFPGFFSVMEELK